MPRSAACVTLKAVLVSASFFAASMPFEALAPGQGLGVGAGLGFGAGAG